MEGMEDGSTGVEKEEMDFEALKKEMLERVEELLPKVDKNKDGKITVAGFNRATKQNHNEEDELLDLFFHVSGWLGGVGLRGGEMAKVWVGRWRLWHIYLMSYTVYTPLLSIFFSHIYDHVLPILLIADVP